MCVKRFVASPFCTRRSSLLRESFQIGACGETMVPKPSQNGRSMCSVGILREWLNSRLCRAPFESIQEVAISTAIDRLKPLTVGIDRDAFAFALLEHADLPVVDPVADLSAFPILVAIWGIF